MKPAMQNAERRIVITSEHNEILVWQYGVGEPHEKTMLGCFRCRDVPSQPPNVCPHLRPRPMRFPPGRILARRRQPIIYERNSGLPALGDVVGDAEIFIGC